MILDDLRAARAGHAAAARRLADAGINLAMLLDDPATLPDQLSSARAHLVHRTEQLKDAAAVHDAVRTATSRDLQQPA